MDISKLRKNKQYAAVLSKIQETIPKAIIAGGAIRDLCHNKSVKDIDIYVPCETPNIDDSLCAYEDDFWENLFDLSGREDYIERPGEDESYEDKNHIGIVWEIQSGGTLYNIILVDIDPIEYVEHHFDIGLCKAWFDGKRFRLTSEFVTDSKNKTLTITANRNIKQKEFDHMMQWHVAKLQRKYPHHSVVIPKRFADMYIKFIDNKVL